MLPYASIGKVNIIPALGLARNISEVDRKTSGCLSCPVYAAMLRGEAVEEKCAACKTKRTLYQNETTRYRYKDPLTKAELFVFLVLHLYGPSSTGVVTDVSAVRLAEECKIAPKTAYEALNGLIAKGYLHLNKDIRGAYTALISDYESYFLPANKGGRGYSVLTKEIFDQLLTIKGSINALRYTLRSYLNIELDAAKHFDHDLVHSESLKQALSYLPGYFRPYNLRRILKEELPSMLSLVKGFGKTIVLRLDPAFFGKNAKQGLLDRQEEEFRKQLEGILLTLNRKERDLVSISEMSDLELTAHASLARLRASAKGKPIRPDDLIKTDHASLISLVQISLEYGKERVLKALKQVWRDWKPGGPDQAACIRTILSEQPATA